MKHDQFTRGEKRRVMYVENKQGLINGVQGRIGWVTFSKTGRSVYYRDKLLKRGNGISGNFFDEATGEEYWKSGIKKKGSNQHYAEPIQVEIDADALEEYRRIKLMQQQD
jgi:hypothetical protein